MTQPELEATYAERDRGKRSWIVPTLFILTVVGLFFVPRLLAKHEQAKIDAWLASVEQIQNPWDRFVALKAEDVDYSNPLSLFSADVRWPHDRLRTLRFSAIDEAIEHGDSRALNYAYTQGYDRVIDKYPRDQAARNKQLDQLTVAWPNIRAMSVDNRIMLVRLAEDCHLQETAALLPARAVVECVASRVPEAGYRRDQLQMLLRSANVGGPVLKPLVQEGK